VGRDRFQAAAVVAAGYQHPSDSMRFLRALPLRLHMTEADVTGRVLAVLERAEEPLSTGTIQQRVASEGLDVATSAIRDACGELIEEGRVEAVGEGARRRYRHAG